MPRISPFTRTWTVAPRNEQDYTDLFEGVEFDAANPMSESEMAKLVEDSVFYQARERLELIAETQRWTDERLAEALEEIESEREAVIETGLWVQTERALSLGSYRDAESWALYQSTYDNAVMLKADIKNVGAFTSANPEYTVIELADEGIAPPAVFALTPHPLNIVINDVRYVLPHCPNAPRIEQDASEAVRIVAGMPVHRVSNRPTLTGFMPVQTHGIAFVVGAMFVGHPALADRDDVLAIDSQRGVMRGSYCGKPQAWVTRLMEVR